MLNKRVIRKLISILIFSFLFFTGLVFLIFPLYSETKKESSPKSQIAGIQTEKSYTPKSSPEVTPEVKISNPTPTTASPITHATSPTPLPKASAFPLVTSSVILSPTPSPLPAQTLASKSVQVNVSINGTSSFTITVDEGANQCDVLKKALEEGKINSLNMQYNSTYNSYAVYQINGIGKENSVWWIYKVNGVPPKSGCSFIKANNGDNIEWQYIGS